MAVEEEESLCGWGDLNFKFWDVMLAYGRLWTSRSSFRPTLHPLRQHWPLVLLRQRCPSTNRELYGKDQCQLTEKSSRRARHDLPL